jgi:hypothetical protein
MVFPKTEGNALLHENDLTPFATNVVQQAQEILGCMPGFEIGVGSGLDPAKCALPSPQIIAAALGRQPPATVTQRVRGKNEELASDGPATTRSAVSGRDPKGILPKKRGSTVAEMAKDFVRGRSSVVEAVSGASKTPVCYAFNVRRK